MAMRKAKSRIARAKATANKATKALLGTPAKRRKAKVVATIAGVTAAVVAGAAAIKQRSKKKKKKLKFF